MASLSCDNDELARFDNASGTWVCAKSSLSRPSADYAALLSILEADASSSGAAITVTSQTTNGFDVEIREDNNISGANTLVDRDWFFEVVDYN